MGQKTGEATHDKLVMKKSEKVPVVWRSGPNLTTTWNRSLAELPNVEIFCSKTKARKSLEEHKCLTMSQSPYSNISNKKHDVSLKQKQNN